MFKDDETKLVWFFILIPITHLAFFPYMFFLTLTKKNAKVQSTVKEY